MTDIAARLWSTYRCDDLQPEHPVRLAVHEIRSLRAECERLREEAARAWALSREHGQQRDALSRELIEIQLILSGEVK